jgi:dihydrofolate reductase
MLEVRRDRMRRVIVINNVTLDGVMQAPGRADEDTRGGFEHGGWAARRNEDPDIGRAMGERMAEGGALLLGRRTYEDFYGFWPKQDSPYTEVLEHIQKYVASTTLSEPLPWANSTLLQGEVAEAVGDLKEQPGKDIGVLGSGELIRTLIAHHLIDEYVLLIHPIVLGTGRRMFPDDGSVVSLQLVDALPTRSGVVITTYQQAEAGGAQR